MLTCLDFGHLCSTERMFGYVLNSKISKSLVQHFTVTHNLMLCYSYEPPSPTTNVL